MTASNIKHHSAGEIRSNLRANHVNILTYILIRIHTIWRLELVQSSVTRAYIQTIIKEGKSTNGGNLSSHCFLKKKIDTA